MSGVKRVLHVFSTFSVGGPQVRSVQLMNHWGSRFEHGIVASDDRFDAFALIGPHVEATRVEDYPPMKGLGLPRTVFATGSYLRKSSWDLLLTYNWGAIETAFANRWLGWLPHIHYEDGFGHDDMAGSNKKRIWFRRCALGSSYALVVPSKTLLSIATQKWRFTSRLVRFIPNGVELKLFEKAVIPTRLGDLVKRPGELWVGCVSGLRPEKNVRRLVRSMASILKERAEVRVVICGTGSEEAVIRQEAARCGVSAQVELVGFQPNSHNYMSLFDVLAIPSDTEQFPICEVEAMAAGLPVAGLDVGDVKAMLSEENQLYISPAGDETQFERVLDRLLSDADLRSTLGVANRRDALAKYSFESIADQHLRAITMAMERL